MDTLNNIAIIENVNTGTIVRLYPKANSVLKHSDLGGIEMTVEKKGQGEECARELTDKEAFGAIANAQKNEAFTVAFEDWNENNSKWYAVG